MKYVFTAVLFCLFFVSMGYASSVTKTVGTSDSTYHYPTIAAAFAAINAGGIMDGNGNPADSVTIVLMDLVYNESELSLAPTTGSPRVVIMDGDAINPTINITQVLGTGVGLRIDSLESFVHACVNISLDTAFTWIAAIEIYQSKEWVKPCPSHVMSIYAPTATTGIRVAADSGGAFTMENCAVVASKRCLFLHGQGIGSSISSVFLKGNTFSGTGADSSVGVSLDSLCADSIVVEDNTIRKVQTGIHQGLGTAADSPGQVGINRTVRIINNNVTGTGVESGVGISLEKGWCFRVKVEDNIIDMGGSGTAIKGIKPWISLDGIAFFTAKSNTISNASSGVTITLDNDTTGLGGIPPDSLTFGSFEISDNVINVLGNGYGVAFGKRDLEGGFGQGGINSIFKIKRNVLNGNGSPGSIGILLDSISVHYVAVDSNTINGFGSGVAERGNHGLRDNVDDGIGGVDRIIKGNTINGIGVESGVGISLEKRWCFRVNVEDNVINMGGSGTAITTLPQHCRPHDGRLIFSMARNTISNASSGVTIKLNNDTTGLGGIPPDSLTFGSFEISDNVMNVVSRGIEVKRGHAADSPGQTPINRIAIKNNVLNGSLDPNTPSLDGIRLDSLVADTVVIESNTIQRFTRSVTNMQSAHEHHSSHQIMSFKNNTITGGTLSLQSIGFDSVRVTNNTLMADEVNILALRVSTSRRQTVDENVPEPFPFAVSGGNVLRHEQAGVAAVDSMGSFVFSGNTITGLADGEIKATDVILHLESNTFHGTGSFLTEAKAGTMSPGSVLTGNALRVSTSRRQTVDFVRPRRGEGPRLKGNTFSDFPTAGLMFTVKNSAVDTEKVLIENNTFSNNGGNGLELVVEGDSGLVILTVVSNIFSNNGGGGLAVLSVHPDTRFKDHRGQGMDNIIVPYAISEGSISSQVTSGDPPNSFAGNIGTGFVLDGNVDVPDGIHFQNFANNGAYNFFNGTNQNIDVHSNWWGTSDSSAIAAKIFDGNDSAGLGVSNFIPFLTESIIQKYVVLSSGWNLVSVPVAVNNYATTDLFPNANSKAFAYAGSYHEEDTLKNGVGYWIKTNAVQSQSIVGLTISSDSIDVVTGWNMIGSVSVPVAVSGIVSVPGGLVTSQFFGYALAYTAADTIRPGSGYWVKVSATGKLVLASGSSVASAAIHIVPTDEMPPAAPEGVAVTTTTHIPTEFALNQNYPNPFNPTTMISIDLPVASIVTLNVYNMLGQEVSILMTDQQMSGGSYRVEWNASNLPTGVYTYRLHATSVAEGKNGVSEFSSVKKMLLVK